MYMGTGGEIKKREGERAEKEPGTDPVMCAHSTFWDVSGFVRLFYILLKNKIFRIFGRHILVF